MQGQIQSWAVSAQNLYENKANGWLEDASDVTSWLGEGRKAG